MECMYLHWIVVLFCICIQRIAYVIPKTVISNRSDLAEAIVNSLCAIL